MIKLNIDLPEGFLDEEERDGYVVPAEMKQVWAIQMDLLSRLIDVCRQNNIKMWVGGGTLLGAVRHHGYIPWDDDVDVMMLREEYDKLMAVGKDAFEQPYFFQNAYTDSGYSLGHAQLRNSQTAAIRPADSFKPYNQGIFIDIFPLDAVPEDLSLRVSTIKESNRIRRFLKARDTNILYSGRLTLIGRKLKARSAVKKHGWSNIYRKSEDLLRRVSIDDCRYVAVRSFTDDKFLFDKHIFDETVWIDFEYIKVPVPKKYHEFLTVQYGSDYMTPRHDSTNHGELVFDTSRSYKEVLPEVRKAFKHSLFKRLWEKISK
jgi:lipopolysaccharide cholinephosphotransferase